LWSTGFKDAYSTLRDFTKHLSQALRSSSKTNMFEDDDPAVLAARLESQQLLARCHLKLGEWQKTLTEDKWDEVFSH